MELQDTNQRISFELNEGAYVHEGNKLSQLGEIEVGDFVKRIKKDDFVEIDSTADNTVKLASTAAIGVVTSTPQGNIPSESKSTDLTLRAATVTILGNGVYSLPLVTTNVAIKSGDALEVVVGGLNKSASTGTNAVAVEEKGANTGGYIDVMLNGLIKVKQ